MGERPPQSDLAVSECHNGGQVEHDAEDGQRGDDERPHDVGQGVDRVGPVAIRFSLLTIVRLSWVRITSCFCCARFSISYLGRNSIALPKSLPKILLSFETCLNF